MQLRVLFYFYRATHGYRDAAKRNRDERACARLIRESLLSGESFSFCLYTARAVNEDAADRRNPNEHGEERNRDERACA